MPPLNSHTHCQAAQAYAKTQAWQRVCLFHRSTETTDKPTDEKEHRTGNSVYVAIAGEVVNRRSVLLRNFVLNGQEIASNPLLHIHANRYMPYSDSAYHNRLYFSDITKNARPVKR